MDIATIVGVIAALTCLMIGIGPHLQQIIDPTQVILVVLGTLSAALIANPLQDVVNLVAVYLRVLFIRVSVPTELIERIVGFAETARREGILALEAAIKQDDDPFLAQGLRLAVDGTEPDLIMDILETELQFIEERHVQAQRMVAFLGVSGLVFGGIGAALAVALQSGTATAGSTVASVAALPLIYGLVIFGIFTEPIRRKLRTYHERESLAKRMIIEGIMSIQSGDNPRIVEHKLSVFVQPKFRPSAESPAETVTTEAAAPWEADPAYVAEVRQYGIEQQDHIVQAVQKAVAQSDAETEEKARVEQLLVQVMKGELPAMAMLARLGGNLRSAVSDTLSQPPAPLVQQVAESTAFTFEHIVYLKDRDIQILMREVSQRDLVFALMGASQELCDRLLGNMSGRVRTFLQEEMASQGLQPAGDVFTVQSRIVAQVFQLVQQGLVSLPAVPEGK
jgi:chemotaxis protein MotA